MYRQTLLFLHFLLVVYCYVKSAIQHMELYIDQHEGKTTYTEFCNDMRMRVKTLQQIVLLLEPHANPDFSINSVGNVGYLLKSYYELHANYQYEQALRYSFGFEGYMDNLRGIYMNYKSDNIGLYQSNIDKY